MSETKEYRADVTLVGELKDDFSDIVLNGKKYLGGVICVTRFSGVVDEIPVYFKQRVNVGEFSAGDVVSITGRINTFLKRKNGRSKMLVCIESIEHTCASDGVNTVFVDGVVCLEPKLRETPAGKKITDLTIAVNFERGSAYIHAITWGRNAYKCAELNVGDFVRCEGRFQSRKYYKQYDDGTGEELTTYECSLSKVN